MGDQQLSNAKIERIILKHPQLTAGERALAWAILANRDETTGLCQVEQGYLAKILDKNRYWVKYRMGKLQAAGVLIRVPDRAGNGKYIQLRYYFLADLDVLSNIATVGNNHKIREDLVCIPIILQSQNCPRMKPLPRAASRTKI